jgi:NADH-quinone oxidoreductase subunit G
MAVNTYWMCDDGMLDYQRLHTRRVSKARVDGKVKPVSRALQKAAKLLDGAHGERIGVVLSAQHSSEDNFALLRLARHFLGARHLFVAGKPAGEGDDILRHTDKNPNRRGVLELCAPDKAEGFSGVLEAIKDGRVKYLLCLGGEADGIDADALNGLASLSAMITLSSHKGALTERADVVLPVAAWAEAEGSYVNARGIVQLSERAVSCLGEARPAFKLLGELAAALGHEMQFKRASDVRRVMSGESDGAALVQTVGAPA